MLEIYDTLSGKLRQLHVRNQAIKILVCGPTVYDHTHVGHARLLLFYDLVARFMRSSGGYPMVVLNITDIDYKIYRKAHQLGVHSEKVATKFISDLLIDMAALGIKDTFSLARVSEYVRLSTELLRILLKDKMVYSANGNVYLDVSTVTMGLLSKMSKEDLNDCRLDIGPNKKNPGDIMLWNASDTFDARFHDDLLGDGIPWWHFQDTTVAMGNFGGMYHIQGGATELVYPHHEFHFAQLQALTGSKRPVQFWTHMGLVTAKGKKMSKSVGNNIAIRDVLKDYPANVLKLYLLSKHYSRPLEFSEKGLEECAILNEKIMASLSRKQVAKSTFVKKFIGFIEKDFDTENALRVMKNAAINNHPGIDEMVKIFGLQY